MVRLNVSLKMSIFSKLFRDSEAISSDEKKFIGDPFLAAESGKTELLRKLIEENDDVVSKLKDGATLLHYAASNLHYDTARLLIESGADPKVKDKSGNLPEHWSVMANEIRMGCPSPKAKNFIDWIREFYERPRTD